MKLFPHSSALVCSSRQPTNTSVQRTAWFQRVGIALVLDILLLLTSKSGSLKPNLLFHQLQCARMTASCSRQPRHPPASRLLAAPGPASANTWWPCRDYEQTPLWFSIPVWRMGNNATYPGRGGFYFSGSHSARKKNTDPCSFPQALQTVKTNTNHNSLPAATAVW